MRVERTYKGSGGSDDGGKTERDGGAMDKNLKQWTNWRMNNEQWTNRKNVGRISNKGRKNLQRHWVKRMFQKSWRESAKKKKENIENESLSDMGLKLGYRQLL